MPATARVSGTPASIRASEEPHTVAIDDEPFDSGDLGDDADGVGEGFLGGQHGMDGAPCKLAVADLAPPGAAHAPSFADRKRREIVMQHEVLFVGAFKAVDELFVFAGAECCYDEGLGFAAGEQRAAMRARQHAHFAYDRAHGLEIAPVDALAWCRDGGAHHIGFQLLEQFLERVLVGLAFAFADEISHGGRLDGVNALVARLFFGDLVGGLEIVFRLTRECCFHRGFFGGRKFARFLGGLFGQADDGVDHLLHLAVAEHHGAQHDVF